nr:MAG TPA: hypothetical protein [Caudoviricetes sp.]
MTAVGLFSSFCPSIKYGLLTLKSLTIFSIGPILGILASRSHVETVRFETPTAFARSSCDMPCIIRKFRMRSPRVSPSWVEKSINVLHLLSVLYYILFVLLLQHFFRKSLLFVLDNLL